MASNHGPAVPHGTFSEYVKGLIFSIILTVISFGVVMTGTFDKATTIVILLTSAVIQLFAQIVYFLHMKRTPDQSWNIVSGFFTVIQVAILVLGTMWIMYHLHFNMQIGH
ncbi:MAG: cytochrome o ubiquinol oxidase subunit IV [Alphaproteobacteria bacterium]